MTVTDSVNTLVQAIEQANSPADLVTAVQALAAVTKSAGSEAGISTLIAVLGYNNPAAAAAAVQGLVQLGDRAVPALLAQIDDYDYGARASSIRALAAIADPRALDVLLAAATDDFAPSVRRAAAKGLGNLRWSRLALEQIQPAQTQALEALCLIARDPDWAIRYAAIVGLQGLVSSEFISEPLAARILAQLQHLAQADPDLTVQARAQAAQQQGSAQDMIAPQEPQL